jgi:hypothetical protein
VILGSLYTSRQDWIATLWPFGFASTATKQIAIARIAIARCEVFIFCAFWNCMKDVKKGVHFVDREKEWNKHAPKITN